MQPDHQRSLAVASPEIDEVLVDETGEQIPAWIAIGEDYERALQLRMALRQGIAADRPILRCPFCTVPVHLVSLAIERKFYFRHEIEDGRCPAKTKGSLSPERILAMKYDGARESAAHKRMKEIVAESLRCDPEFSNVEVEKLWKGVDANSRRRPDVRAVWRETLPVAFEVQLSTTFLRVIAERREFYLREGGLLFWVFKDFNLSNARLTQEDVFFNNNRNAFIASEETLAASRESGSLFLDCVWSEPSVHQGLMLWDQHSERVQFSSLTIDKEGQRVFLFDADAARARCEAELADCPLRSAFKKFWLAKGPESDSEWQRLRSELARRGVALPKYMSDAHGLRPLLDSMYSAEAGKPVGRWGYANLVQLAHHVFDRYKGHLWAFRLMLSAHKMGSVISQQDTTRNWRDNKVRHYRNAWQAGNSDFAPDRTYDSLLCILFPEIASDLVGDPSMPPLSSKMRGSSNTGS